MRRFFNILLVLGVPAFIGFLNIFPLLGWPDVYQVSEGREGVVVNSILSTGEYILPLRQGELIPSKPPLFHWLSAFVANVVGSYSNFELRFVSALAGLALLLHFGAFLLCYFGARVSVLASLMLITTDGFLRMAADGRVDMLLTYFVTAALLVWFHYYLRSGSAVSMPARAYWYVSGISGLSILVKGPLGLVIPALVMFVYVATTERIAGIRSLIRKEWAFSFIISVPWYVLATFVGHTDFLGRQLIFENIDRFTGAKGITPKPVWFYFVEYWPHALPWSLGIFGFGIYLLRQKLQGRAVNNSLFAAEAKEKRSFAFFCGVWFLSLVSFYTLSSGKRAAYLLTVIPPSLALLALCFDSKWEEFRLNLFESATGKIWLKRAGLLGSAIMFFLTLVMLLAPVLPEGMFLGARTKFTIIEFLNQGSRVFLVSAVLLPLLAALLWFRGVRVQQLWLIFVSFFLVSECVFVHYATVIDGVRGITHGYRRCAQQMSRLVPETERVEFIKKKRDESFDGFFFYFRRVVYLFEPAKGEAENEITLRPEKPGFYFARKGWIAEQPDSWTSRLELKGECGRRVDKDEKKISLVLLKASEVETPQRALPAAASPELANSTTTN